MHAVSGVFQKESMLNDTSVLYKMVNYNNYFNHIGSKASMIMYDIRSNYINVSIKKN